jgi:hypothetical protein
MGPGGSAPAVGTARLGFFVRIAPAVGLFVLSPFVAEFLLGNISVSDLAAVLFVAPMYGGGALLVREVTRRSGRGWPTMLVLALVYAIVEEGLVTQTLFNPSYFDLDLLSATRIPGIGLSAGWTLFVLTLHVVWSVSVPIGMVEAFVPGRSTQPWLGKLGLTVAAVLFVAGGAANFFGTYASEHFLLSVLQLVGTLAAILILTFLAFRIGARTPRVRAGSAPNPWLVGGFALAVSSAFMALNMLSRREWLTVVGFLLLYALAVGLATMWSRSDGWSDVHRFALAGGALLTYAWYGIPAEPILGDRGTTDLVGNIVFASAAVVLLAAACLRLHNAHRLQNSPRVGALAVP